MAEVLKVGWVYKNGDGREILIFRKIRIDQINPYNYREDLYVGVHIEQDFPYGNFLLFYTKEGRNILYYPANSSEYDDENLILSTEKKWEAEND